MNGENFELAYNTHQVEWKSHLIELFFCGDYQKTIIDSSDIVMYGGVLERFSMNYVGQVIIKTSYSMRPCENFVPKIEAISSLFCTVG